MIDFSTLKGLTIPEGNVTQIADAAGNVLWSAAPATATINIISPWGINYNANVTIDGVEYNSAVEIEVPIGTTVFCTALDLYGNRQYITLNGTQVASDTYEYTVVGNATIELTDDYGSGSKELYGIIHITEE